MDNTIASKTIRRKRNSDVEAGQKKQPEHDLAKWEARLELRSRAERLAGDRICLMNWKFPEAADHFPVEPWMRTVTKYFRDAVGGPLAIDEPELPYQVERAERRRPILKELGEKYGFRYVILYPGKTEADDHLELSKCGQI
jgi:hypothetical protein